MINNLSTLCKCSINLPITEFNGFRYIENNICVPEILLYHLKLGRDNKKLTLKEVIGKLNENYELERHNLEYTAEDIIRVIDWKKCKGMLLDKNYKEFLITKNQKSSNSLLFVGIFNDNHLYYCDNRHIVKSIRMKNIKKISHTYENIEKKYILSKDFCPSCERTEFDNIQKEIQKKISCYKCSDTKRFGYAGNVTKEDVFCLFNKQKGRCYVCDDIVLTSNFKPYCLYQFSLDRLDNQLPHNKDNVLISCYYCNCISYWIEVLDIAVDDHKIYKICGNNCHCEKRDIQKKRNDISRDIINLFKLI